MGQMVCPYLIVEDQRVVAVAPDITDTGFLIDHQCRNVQRTKAGRECQPALRPANDKRIRFVRFEMSGILLRGHPLFGPVERRLNEVRSVIADFLFMPLQIPKGRKNGPGSPIA